MFKLVRAVSKSVGRVTFWSALKLGMLNCGTLMSPNGLILLTAFTADWIAEFAAPISFCIPERMLLNVLVRKLLNCERSVKSIK